MQRRPDPQFMKLSLYQRAKLRQDQEDAAAKAQGRTIIRPELFPQNTTVTSINHD